jgi:hypothetical protein
MPSKTFVTVPYDGRAMAADETQIPLDEQLEEIGAQLDWVRGYL